MREVGLQRVLQTYGGRNYVPVGENVVVAPHALVRADKRGPGKVALLKKLYEERDALLTIVASRLGSGDVRGVFYLTFDTIKGKVLWELMSPEGKRLESVEEVEETTAIVVVYTYLHISQKFYKETPFSKKRRERDNQSLL